MVTKLLITGATGCSGSYQIKNILNNFGAEFEIHATKRPRSSLDLIDTDHQKVVTFYNCELTDAFAVSNLLRQKKPDLIMHYAADTFIPPSATNPDLYILANSKMVLNILNAVRLIRRDCPDYDPVVFIPSSLAVYGLQFENEDQYRRHLAEGNGVFWPPPRYENSEFVSEQPVREENLLRPASPYAVGKCTIENMARLYRGLYGIRTVVIRCCNQTGPGRLPNFAETFFAFQVALIVHGYLPPKIRHGNLKPLRDFLDYRDAVRGHFAYVKREMDGCNCSAPVNIGTGQCHRVQEVLDFYLEKAKDKGIEIETEIDPAKIRLVDTPMMQIDNSRIRELTGWKPEIPFEKTLEDIYTYWFHRVEREGKNGNYSRF